MASHGKKRHTKRISMPVANPAARKLKKWMKTTSAGAHAKKQSAPLVSVLRDLLKVTENEREAKRVLNDAEVKVDGRVVRDKGFAVGLMDVVEIPKLKLSKTIIFVNSKLRTTNAHTGEKLCKITGKKLIAGGKVQLNLHDGRNITTAKTTLKTGDTVKISVPAQKIIEEIKLEKGVHCYVTNGRHSGQIGLLEEVIEFAGSTRPNVKLKSPTGDEIITLKDYIFAVNKNFTV